MPTTWVLKRRKRALRAVTLESDACCCCCCCSERSLNARLSTSPKSNWQRPCAKSPGSKTPGDSGTPGSPRRRRTLHRRGLEKLALNSGITGRARKMAQNATTHRRHNQHGSKSSSSLLHNGNVHCHRR